MKYHQYVDLCKSFDLFPCSYDQYLRYPFIPKLHLLVISNTIERPLPKLFSFNILNKSYG